MSDLVERLIAPFATDGVILSFPNGQTDIEGLRDACREAADEITRLRAENEINRAHSVEHYEWLVKEREDTAHLRAEVERLRALLVEASDLLENQTLAGFYLGGDRRFSTPDEHRLDFIRRAREAMGEGSGEGGDAS